MSENVNNRFEPGMTELVESVRRYEQRRMDLLYAFAEDPELRRVYDVTVRTYPNMMRKFTDGTYEINSMLIPRQNDASESA